MAAPPRALAFRFTGRASEYFRVWIVGIALSVLTLGVYSAWAKVRTQQYLYRHTWLEGTSFEYLAVPRDLLAGRALLAAVLVAVFLLEVFYSAAAAAAALVYIAAEPWVIVRSVGFRARNSAFRNVRFGFWASLGDAYRVFLRGYLNLLITCGVAYPWFRRRRTEFVLSGLRYGGVRANWFEDGDSFAGVYFRTMLMALPWLVWLVASGRIEWRGPAAIALKVISSALIVVPYVYLRAELANLMYGGVVLGEHRLLSKQRFWPLLGIYLTNTLAVLGSAGLAIPWAKMRLTRYVIESLELSARGSLEVAAGSDASGRYAYGDAAADLGGIDIGIG